MENNVFQQLETAIDNYTKVCEKGAKEMVGHIELLAAGYVKDAQLDARIKKVSQLFKDYVPSLNMENIKGKKIDKLYNVIDRLIAQLSECLEEKTKLKSKNDTLFGEQTKIESQHNEFKENLLKQSENTLKNIEEQLKKCKSELQQCSKTVTSNQLLQQRISQQKEDLKKCDKNKKMNDELKETQDKLKKEIKECNENLQKLIDIRRQLTNITAEKNRLFSQWKQCKNDKYNMQGIMWKKVDYELLREANIELKKENEELEEERKRIKEECSRQEEMEDKNRKAKTNFDLIKSKLNEFLRKLERDRDKVTIDYASDYDSKIQKLDIDAIIHNYMTSRPEYTTLKKTCERLAEGYGTTLEDELKTDQSGGFQSNPKLMLENYMRQTQDTLIAAFKEHLPENKVIVNMEDNQLFASQLANMIGQIKKS